MLPDRVSNPGPLTYESGALLIALCCPAHNSVKNLGAVMVLVLSMLSDNALYMYQVLSKYLIRFQSLGPEQ